MRTKKPPILCDKTPVLVQNVAPPPPPAKMYPQKTPKYTKKPPWVLFWHTLAGFFLHIFHGL